MRGAATTGTGWWRRARRAAVAAVAVLCMVSLGCEEAISEPEPLSHVALKWAGAEAPGVERTGEGRRIGVRVAV